MEFYKPNDKQYILNIIRSSQVVYASMEIGLHEEVNTYSGGLGILAGDTLRSCADKGIRVVATTLMYKKGYFKQKIEGTWQQEEDEPWNYEKFLLPFPEYKVTLQLHQNHVTIQPWVGIIVGKEKDLVPIIFLDSDLEENNPEDRNLTNHLYLTGQENRLKQEAILGIAGKRALRKFNLNNIDVYHMNEGHAALAPMEDVVWLKKHFNYNPQRVKELVKNTHVFTTHTPVPAGHDTFKHDLINNVLSQQDIDWSCLQHGTSDEVNMTHLAMNMSRYINAVAKKHGEVSRKMFPKQEIDYVTNGIHLPTWLDKNIQHLYDEKMPGWRERPDILKKAEKILQPNDVWQAHQKAKHALIQHVKNRTGEDLNVDTLTIGFARRFATYKRANLMFTDIEKFKEATQGKVQILFAGEAHPADEAGKKIIQDILNKKEELKDFVHIVFIPDYDIETGRRLVSGCDIWQNNPVPPKEASGTSGMKAVANGVPNLSTLDGWWIEGVAKKPNAGWIIQHDGQTDHESLYKQYKSIVHTYYENKEEFKNKMIKSICLGSFFNTHRMVDEYREKAWIVK